jgi:hypothetical protein
VALSEVCPPNFSSLLSAIFYDEHDPKSESNAARLLENPAEVAMFLTCLLAMILPPYPVPKGYWSN